MGSRVVAVLVSLVVVAVAVLAGVLTGVRERPVHVTGPVVGVAARTATSVDRDHEAARRVLAEWDQRRAEAWGSGDPCALAALYASGSPVGRVDTTRFAAWRDRGLRVEGLLTQVLAFEVVSRTPERLVVDVVDRVVGGTAIGRGTRIALPRTRAVEHRVTLVRVDGVWLVA